MSTKSPYIISIKETINYINNNNSHNKNFIKKSNKNNMFSPLSGYEPKYEPKKWNKNKNIKANHNCYAYALNRYATNRGNKSQPGYFSNFPPLKDTDYSCATFIKRLKKDNPSLYITDFNTKCRPGFYKAFLALDTKDEDMDYHFYRQDDNKYWSHKPGRTDIKNYDASFKKIKNPLIANRKYDYFNYSLPCFFFCVNSKLSSLYSTHT